MALDFQKGIDNVEEIHHIAHNEWVYKNKVFLDGLNSNGDINVYEIP